MALSQEPGSTTETDHSQESLEQFDTIVRLETVVEPETLTGINIIKELIPSIGPGTNVIVWHHCGAQCCPIAYITCEGHSIRGQQRQYMESLAQFPTKPKTFKKVWYYHTDVAFTKPDNMTKFCH